jgi:ATP-binding cassette, subfamily B, bacterial
MPVAVSLPSAAWALRCKSGGVQIPPRILHETRDASFVRKAVVVELSEFPSASARDTVSFCWEQVEGQKGQLVSSWVVVVLAVVMADVVCPIIFASILSSVAALGRHPGAREWHTFGPLLLDYAGAGLVAIGLWRVAGWLEWGACLRSFARGINHGYAHLLKLSYRWHMDHPAGEVISALGNFSWAFAEMVDVGSWGLLPVAVIVLSAVVVLAVVAWPAALAMLVMVSGFVFVLSRRLPQVRAASEEFENDHSKATGVVADTVTNLMAVWSSAAEPQERQRVRTLMGQSVDADLRGRSIFMRTQLQLEISIVIGTLLALVAGTTMAVHHWASTGSLYLILFYSAQVAMSLQQSFEYLRLFTRSLGRAAKFTAIAATAVEIADAPGARSLSVPSGGVEFSRIEFGYRRGTVLFDDLTLSVAPGEHVALVGPSGSGKSTLPKLLLRFMDVDGGRILVDGQDIRGVTLASLRRRISFVPQDPQLLHRSIAENICYGVGGDVAGGVDYDLVHMVGKAAHVEEFVYALPDRYDTIVGERGLKLSGGQRQRVAIAQAMAKGAPILVLDEATSALDSESEHLVQEAMWRLMEESTALVIAHRLSTIAHMDRIVVFDQGRIVEEGTHRELLSPRGCGLYERLWRHQSGGFLVE